MPALLSLALSHVFMTLLAVLTALYAIALHPGTVAKLPSREGPPIAAARTWGYQLQNANARTIPDGIDVLVVDFARDGATTLSKSVVEGLARRSDGSRRIVLAYMSIGEAESYRWYWQSSWRFWWPDWLGSENPNWKGNYAVRYWDRDWQRIIVDPEPKATTLLDKALILFDLRPRSYLERIISAGFDGVYLDRVDAYYTPLEPRTTARADMIAFVGKISRHAKSRKAGFLVVPQNAEELLADAGYRRMIDAVAKEDLLYGGSGDGQPNPEDDVTDSIRLLDTLKADGKPVFVVEYLTDAAQRMTARDRIGGLGYRMTFARRPLSDPPELVPMTQTTTGSLRSEPVARPVSR